MVEVPPAGSKRRSAHCPELLVLYKIHKVSPLISEKSKGSMNYVKRIEDIVWKSKHLEMNLVIYI